MKISFIKEALGTKRVLRKFAWVPTKMCKPEDTEVWLEHYLEHQEYCYTGHRHGYSVYDWVVLKREAID